MQTGNFGDNVMSPLYILGSHFAQILQHYPNGLTPDLLRAEYRIVFKRDVDPTQYDFDDLHELLECYSWMLDLVHGKQSDESHSPATVKLKTDVALELYGENLDAFGAVSNPEHPVKVETVREATKRKLEMSSSDEDENILLQKREKVEKGAYYEPLVENSDLRHHVGAMLCHLMTTFVCGISIKKLFAHFKDEYRQEIPIKQMGYESKLEFISQFAPVLNVIKKAGNNSVIKMNRNETTAKYSSSIHQKSWKELNKVLIKNTCEKLRELQKLPANSKTKELQGDNNMACAGSVVNGVGSSKRLSSSAMEKSETDSDCYIVGTVPANEASKLQPSTAATTDQKVMSQQSQQNLGITNQFNAHSNQMLKHMEHKSTIDTFSGCSSQNPVLPPRFQGCLANAGPIPLLSLPIRHPEPFININQPCRPSLDSGRFNLQGDSCLSDYKLSFPPCGGSKKFSEPEGNMKQLADFDQPLIENASRCTARTKEQVNNIAQFCIDRLAELNEFVSFSAIEKLLCRELKINNVVDLRLGLRRFDDLDCIQQHLRTQRRVNACVQAFVKVRNICTLFELNESLGDYVPNKMAFETLKLGPLTRQPILYDIFKIPSDMTDILPIRTADVYEHLRNYLSRNDLWTQKIDMEKFMEYLVEVYGVKSPYYLGIRITSGALMIQQLKKAQRDCGSCVRSTKAELMQNTEKKLTTAFRQFCEQLLIEENGTCKIKSHFAQFDAMSVVQQFANVFKALYDTLHLAHLMSQPGNTEERHWRHVGEVMKFMAAVKKLPIFAQLFQLALIVCADVGTATGYCNHVLEVLANVMPARLVTSHEIPADLDVKSLGPEVSTDEVIAKVKEYLHKCLIAGSLTLTHLHKIETKLNKDYDVNHFGLLRHGSFLEFLTNPAIKPVLEESVGQTLGSGKVTTRSLYCPSRHELVEFLTQCRTIGMSQDNTEYTACEFFKVKEIKDFGHGSLSHLLQIADKRVKDSKTFPIIFEKPLCDNSPCKFTGKTGILGHQSEQAAVSCLRACPLLFDMDEWSMWAYIFAPQFGTLKEFVTKHGSVAVVPGHSDSENGNLLALEVDSGRLLKLPSTTSLSHFCEAVKQRDVTSTCAHLVSLVVHYKGIKSTPLMLLCNAVQDSMQTLLNNVQNNAEMANQRMLLHFVLECLCQLPANICISVAFKVFLEPIAHFLGSAQSKQLLLTACHSPAHYSRLHVLGVTLGIAEWRDHFLNGLTSQQVVEEPKKKQSDFALGFADIDSDLDDVYEFVEEEDDDYETLSDSEDDSSIQEITPMLRHAGNVGDTRDLQIFENSFTKMHKKVDMDVTKDSPETTSVEDIVKCLLSDILAEVEVRVIQLEDDVSCVEPEDKCKKLIELIREEEFGVGIELSEDGKKLMKKQQERLGRSLERLSKELYSKDTHFVLELIQNADDNEYPLELNDIPSITFIVNRDEVSVLNNECGFQEKNIRAVCDVGKTTKGKHKYGYIGQKGIGFKSVFRVTNKPEIHSNGYHMMFDLECGPMGYILPHWLPCATNCQDTAWTTRIVLPLKPSLWEETKHTPESLASRFHDIHPALLLFLHRLRKIIVIDEVENATLAMQRRDLDNGIVQIHHNTGTDYWLVAKKLVDATTISLKAKSGIDVESSEIALAFPVRKLQQTRLGSFPLKQPAFAFLPLRSYGFRFIIQGDFDVPSSREDVDSDSAWNQWLRCQIPSLFVESLEYFKNQPGTSDIQAVCQFLQFIPLEDEILGFFKPVASEILHQLRAQPCIPTQPFKGKQVEWKTPNRTVIASSPLLYDVVNPSLLLECLGLYYVHRDVSESLNNSLLTSLGAQVVTTQHLLEIGKTLAVSPSMMPPVDHISIVCKWLACLYHSLEEFQDNNAIFDQLRQLHVIPLMNKTWVRLLDNTVFFPLSDLQHTHRKQSVISEALQADVNTIDPELFSHQDKILTLQVQKILEHLGVKQLQPFDIVIHHIIPTLKSETWKEKSLKILEYYVVYVKEQMEKSSNVNLWEEVQPVLKLRTNHGVVAPAEQFIYFSTHYGNKLDLSQQLPGYDWTLLDPCYLVHDENWQNWRRFFAKLGVQDFLTATRDERVITRDNASVSPWSSLVETWPETEDQQYLIKDWRSKELMCLLKKNHMPNTMRNQMTHLCTVLDKEWDTGARFKQYTEAEVCDGDGNVLCTTVSSFSLLLKTTPWLPTVNFRGNSQETLSIPHNVYLNVPEIKKLLTEHALYLKANINVCESTFAEHINLKTVLTVDALIEHLQSWSARDHLNSNIPALFSTSLSHMKAVYLYLSHNVPPNKLNHILANHPVIFIPSTVATNPAMVTQGKFHFAKDLCWNDPSGMMSKYQALMTESGFQPQLFLCDIYYQESERYSKIREPDYRQLFIYGGGVREDPPIMDYVQLVQIIATKNEPPTKPIIHDVCVIFETLGKRLTTGQLSNDMSNDVDINNLKESLLQARIFPTKCSKWVSSRDDPILPDNAALQKVFSACREIMFLDIDVSQQRIMEKRYKLENQKKINETFVGEFLRVCDIKKLSECVDTEFVTESYQPSNATQHYIYTILPIIQRYLYTKHEDAYLAAKSRNLAAVFKVMTCASVGKLELIYRIKHKPEVVVSKPEICRIAEDGMNFYVHKDNLRADSELNKELSRFICKGHEAAIEGIRGFLARIKPKQLKQSELLEQYLKEEDIEEIPSNEEVWLVMPPRAPMPQPPSPLSVPVSSKEQKSVVSDVHTLMSWPPMSGNASRRNASDGSHPELKLYPIPERPQQVVYMPPQEISTNEEPPDKKLISDVEQIPAVAKSLKSDHSESKNGVPTSHSDKKIAKPTSAPTRGSEPGERQKHKISTNEVEICKITKSDRELQNDKAVSSVTCSKSVQFLGHTQTGTEGTFLDRGDASPEHIEGQGHVEFSTSHSPFQQQLSAIAHQDLLINDQDYVQEYINFTTSLRDMEHSPIKNVFLNLDEIVTDSNPEVFEHLEWHHDIENLPSEIPEDCTDTESIGRWGENFIYTYLKHIKETEEVSQLIDVVWVNEHSETGQPFDIALQLKSGNGNLQTVYIEVKSTVKGDRCLFQISAQQLSCAFKYKENYHLYRVFNAGSQAKAHIVRLKDLANKLIRQEVKLYMCI